MSSRFWVYVNKEPLYGPGHISELNLPDELANVDGALEWNRNGKIYIFKGSNYWRYDKTRQKIEDGYPRHISAWRGIPSNIDAVFQWKNGRSYFFKGTKYYAFDDYSVKVLESPNPYPRDVAAYWMGCTNPEIKLQPRLSASTLGSVPNLFLFPLFFMISQLL